VFGGFCLFERGCYYVAQAGLELLVLLPQALSAGISGTHYHARPCFSSFKGSKRK
jgi:hypothetical protein